MEIIQNITQCLLENKPVIFLKFGDGEYNCAFGNYGANCDNDIYTPKLSFYIKESLNIL